jgi:hypothetical protein
LKIAVGFSYLNAKQEIPWSLDPWYDRPEIDYIIALNGRFRTPLPPWIRQKHNSNYSTDGSEHILKTRYPEKIVHENVYTTQMEKRQRIFEIAGELKCDYVIVIDSDETIHPQYQDWDLFFKQLAAVHKFWKNERIMQLRLWIPDEALWPRQLNIVMTESWRNYYRIHKNPETMRYVFNHYSWADKNVTEEQINSWTWDPKNSQFNDLYDNPNYIHSNIVMDGIRLITNRQKRAKTELEFGENWTFQEINWENFKRVEARAKTIGFHMKGEDVPMERLYFRNAGQLKDEMIGQIVLLNEDGTEVQVEQYFENDQLVVKSPDFTPPPTTTTTTTKPLEQA